MHFETNVDHGTHSTVSGMPGAPGATNRVTLEAGEWLEVVVNTKGGPKVFNLISSGYVVGFEEASTEDGILFRLGGTTAILNGKIHGTTQK